MVSMQIMAHPTSLSLKLKNQQKDFISLVVSQFFMTKCNEWTKDFRRNANEICADNINFFVYEMVNMSEICIEKYQKIEL